MPTRYGCPDAAMRTLPQRQPPVKRSMLHLPWNQVASMFNAVILSLQLHGRDVRRLNTI